MTYYVMTRENLADLYEAWPKSEQLWSTARKVEAQHGNLRTAYGRHHLKKAVEPILAPAFEVLARCGHPMGKTRAVLVAEGARYLDRIGATEGWVKNYGVAECMYFEENQTWYLFKENGAWFYKQREKYKTAHRIEEVLA